MEPELVTSGGLALRKSRDRDFPPSRTRDHEISLTIVNKCYTLILVLLPCFFFFFAHLAGHHGPDLLVEYGHEARAARHKAKVPGEKVIRITDVL